MNYCYYFTVEKITIPLCKQISSKSFKDVITYKLCVQQGKE